MKHVIILLIVIAFSHASFAQDVSLDKKLGAENAVSVEQEMGIYHHDSLYALVSAVGQKLVAALESNPFEFKFFLVDSPEPNAFALPGGYVYVTRGILPLIQTEDELAGIMGHEIIHVTRRHSVKQMRKGLIGGILEIPGNLINAVTGTHLGNIINVPIGLASKAFISKYSRGHESEADALGIQLTARAGYQTAALADALERLQKEIELITEKAEQHNYFSDHPLTSNRIASIRRSAPNYKSAGSPPVTSSQKVFLRNFNGLCFGLNPQQGLFKDSLFVQPDLEFSWVVPSRWRTLNKPTVAGAYTETGDGIIVLQMTNGKKSIHDSGEEARNKAIKANLDIISGRDTIINSLPAYVLRVKSKDKRDQKSMELAWIAFQQGVILITGVTVPKNEKEIHRAIGSFRKSDKGELATVKLHEMRLVSPEKNETIEQLSVRTGNKLNLPLTTLFNNVGSGTSLEEGAVIKVVVSGPYQPRR